MSFKKEWKEIVDMNIVQVYQFNEFDNHREIAVELDQNMADIFDMLFRIKNNKFYNNKEIESIYLLIRPSIMTINEILMMLNNKITGPIYEIILNVFEELILLAEDYENYEVAGNLLEVRDYWFNCFNIRINTVKGAK